MRPLPPFVVLLASLSLASTACDGSPSALDTGAPPLDAPAEDASSLDGAALDGAALDGAAFDGAAFDGAAFDGAAFDGAAFDGAAFDGALLEVGTVDLDATVRGDAAGDAGCTRSEPTRMAGICDGRGRAICQMWSDSLAGGRMTTSLCLGTGGFCARADTCTSVDPESCTCGAGPRCADDQVCVFSADRAPHCECITP